MVGTPELHLALLTREIPATDYLHVCEYLEQQGYIVLKQRKDNTGTGRGILDCIFVLTPKGREYIEELKQYIKDKNEHK